jgi:cell division septation protein DedD
LAAIEQQRRMIIAFTLFVALLGVVAGALLYKAGILTSGSKTPQKEASSLSERRAAATGESGIFYDRIGVGPATGTSPEIDSQAIADTFTLEIKVTTSREEAERVIDALKMDGIEAYYTPMTRSGRIVYRVRRGLFTHRGAAEAASVALKESSGIASKVTKLQ